MADGGRAVLAGVRPHDLLLAADGEPGAFPARVDVVEELGSESYAYVLAGVSDLAEVELDLDTIARAAGGELRLCLRLDRGVHVRPGDRVTLRIADGATQLFDGVSGRAL
jgi:ABC-type sugar transport system ATPase subunit